MCAPAVQVGFSPPFLVVLPTSLHATSRLPMSVWTGGAVFSGDIVFRSYVDALPGLLKEAMVKRGLADPGILSSHPLPNFQQLGLELRSVVVGAGTSMRSTILSCIPPSMLTDDGVTAGRQGSVSSGGGTSKPVLFSTRHHRQRQPRHPFLHTHHNSIQPVILVRVILLVFLM